MTTHIPSCSPSPLDNLLAEREKTHGDFRDHAYISQFLKENMRRMAAWHNLSECQRESLEMIAHKIARIISGNPSFKDHWDDIAGYATLISKQLDDARSL
jgi:hypothetical protein